MLNEERTVGKEPLAACSRERVVFPKWTHGEAPEAANEGLPRADSTLRAQLGFSFLPHIVIWAVMGAG